MNDKKRIRKNVVKRFNNLLNIIGTNRFNVSMIRRTQNDLVEYFNRELLDKKKRLKNQPLK